MVVSLVSVVSPADDASYVSKGVGAGSARSSAFFYIIIIVVVVVGVVCGWVQVCAGVYDYRYRYMLQVYTIDFPDILL